MKSKFFVFTIFLGLLSCCPYLSAQAVGEIVGTVRDQTGASVPNAKVTATRTATGISQSTVTGAEDLIRFPTWGWELTLSLPRPLACRGRPLAK